jgi:starch phosphorylase
VPRHPDLRLDLESLAGNLFATWDPAARELFARLDPETWARTGGNPLAVVDALDRERLAETAADAQLDRLLHTARGRLKRLLEGPAWYDGLSGAPHQIAYLSPEFGVAQILPQYSGGLGILAGDHLKAASDLRVPVAGVGLLYREGYFEQTLSADGTQQEEYADLDPHALPLKPMKADDAGNEVRVSLDLPDGRLQARVWRALVGGTMLLLLDSDVEENSTAGRAVTDRLYSGDGEHRLRQELLLGVGGARALVACGLRPDVFHLNEGHAAFSILERMRVAMEDGVEANEAAATVGRSTVFTTHTPVPAGIDRFPAELVRPYLAAAFPGLPPAVAMGLGTDEGGAFNMAVLALRVARHVNGVSRLHGRVAREMFAGLWPGRPVDEVPIGSVTNGVHLPTWTAAPAVDLVRLDDAGLWECRSSLRAAGIEVVRRRLGRDVLDPGALTIGFARRVPAYKRLTLILRDPRLVTLVRDAGRPLQLVAAGKAHPADEEGKELIRRFHRFAAEAGLEDRLVFVPGYDIELATALTSAADVWLNNPLRPLEASGTSGMKAVLNGGLNLSIRDGWWDELFDGANGWAVPSSDDPDPERRDDAEAAAILDLLEGEVVPRFYDRDEWGLPRAWLSMVRHSLETLGPAVDAERMVREYVERYYVPAASAATG